MNLVLKAQLTCMHVCMYCTVSVLDFKDTHHAFCLTYYKEFLTGYETVSIHNTDESI